MYTHHVIACHVLWREICHFASLSRHCFQFTFLPQGLHNTPDVLRSSLQEAIDRDDGASDAILLGYGLCSNGLMDIRARQTPLVIMRGHDCITFLLGSKKRYRSYFDEHPGTYWYSPGWIETCTQPGKERYEQTLARYIETYGEENAEYLMQMEQNWMRAYNNAAYVDLGVGDSTPYRDYTRACAEHLDWNYDLLEGDPGLMRRFLEGDWDSEDFLIVKPGQVIRPSHDEGIIKAVTLEEKNAGSG